MSTACVPFRAVIVIHQALLQEHGGLLGPSRLDSLAAVLAQPQRFPSLRIVSMSAFRINSLRCHTLIKAQAPTGFGAMCVPRATES